MLSLLLISLYILQTGDFYYHTCGASAAMNDFLLVAINKRPKTRHAGFSRTMSNSRHQTFYQ